MRAARLSKARLKPPGLTRQLYLPADAKRALERLERPDYWPTGQTLKSIRRRWGVTTRAMARVLSVQHEEYQIAEQGFAVRLPRDLAISTRLLFHCIVHHSLSPLQVVDGADLRDRIRAGREYLTSSKATP